jgi:5,10-methylenetetrahydromethanopterin reductase
VWQADSRLVRDAIVPMSAFAAVTDAIKIGSGVVDCWTRNPARLAATFSTLDDLAPGRVILGIGAWWDPLAAKVGISRAKPLRAMREIITAVRGLLANETVTMNGEFVQLDGVELDYVYQDRRPKDVPIYLGATGMQMMELAGEIADGVVLNYLVSPDYNKTAIEALAKGADKAGRKWEDIDRPKTARPRSTWRD